MSSVERRPRRGRTVLVVLAVVLGLALALAAAYGVVWLMQRDTVPARTSIGGVEVGGLSQEEARAAVVAAATDRLDDPVRLLGPTGSETTTGQELGAEPLVEPALEEALDAGPLTGVARRLGLGDDRNLPLEYRLGPVRAAELANRLDARFGEPAVDAEVTVDGTDIEVSESSPGTGVDRRALRRALVWLPDDVELRFGPSAPAVTTAAAEEAAARIETLLARPRVVRYGGVDATVWPKRLGELVRTEPGDGDLVVRLDGAELARALRPRLGRFERAAEDASFVPQGRRVRLVPSQEGLGLDGAAIGASLLKNDEARAHLARFRVTAPELTTAEARKLGIKELISEFTTYHPCCAPRVNNIHRGADIMDGTIVRPGETFSLNEVMGKRTVERGFVEAPQIFNGRLEDAVGGGVSQIATTTFNAAFFAGVRLVTHQPHQFYISRYPMGREATVSWGGPELIWKNDWPAAILVDTAYTDTSITVRFYSSKLGRKVTTTMGEPCCYVAPRTITVSNSGLAPGTRDVVQEAGPSGFTISYTRKVFKDGKLRRNERYTWRYDAENAIVEVGPPAKPKPKPKPEPGAKPKPTPEPTEPPPA